MPAILPSIQIDSDSALSKHFLPYQVHWIQAEQYLRKPAMALAEKSVRIGWTYGDAFKNVRKRLLHKDRDYLFATKDFPSALEFVRQCYKFAEIFELTNGIVRHGEEFMQVNRLDESGRPSSLTEDVRVGMIKFDNGSRIIAFSANPQAMAVYGGDVGLDEFAKHPNARLLWETAQGRAAWGYDVAVWSSHDGEDTLFNQFVREARAGRSFEFGVSGFESKEKELALTPALSPGEREELAADSRQSLDRDPHSRSQMLPPREPRKPSGLGERVGVRASADSELRPSPLALSTSPRWNLYYRVTMADAIEMGLVEVINRTRGLKLTREEFLASCRSRAGEEEIFQQAYMCNPQGAASSRIVEWSAIERCRYDYEIERVHLEEREIVERFGELYPPRQANREREIADFLRAKFSDLFKIKRGLRLGFDVAASGSGDMAAIYIDEAEGSELWLRGLFTCRTADWHFLKTVLFWFLKNLPEVKAAGDETGLGKQICWEAAAQFGWAFTPVNFSSRKHDLGLALMNQLATAQKRFPRSEQDIASDYYALRRTHNGSKWSFSEGRNDLNPASHCDIAWAGALATEARQEHGAGGHAGATLCLEGGVFKHY